MAPSSSSTTRMVCTAFRPVRASDVAIGVRRSGRGACGLASDPGGHALDTPERRSHLDTLVSDVELPQTRIVATVPDLVNRDEPAQARAPLYKPQEHQVFQ